MTWRVLVAAVCLGCGARTSLDSEVLDGGQSETSIVIVSPSSMDFGSVDCGSVGQAKTVTITNGGSTSFSFAATLASGPTSPYTISQTSGVVAPGGTAQITVSPLPIPQNTNASSYGDSLEIQTSIAGDQAHVVPLTETATGAILSWSSTVAFGKKLVGTQAVIPFTVTNSGNVDATIALATSQSFAIASPQVTVPANSAISVDVSYTPDASTLGTPVSADMTLSLSTPTVLCAPLPTTTVIVSGTPADLATAIGAGEEQMCAIGQSGNLYCWGYGSLGDGSSSESARPVLALAKGAKSVAGMYGSMCVTTSTGTVECWGDAPYIGDGASNGSATPVQALGLTDAKRVVSGQYALGLVPFDKRAR